MHMNVKITKYHLNYALLLLLVTAFLTMQWATVHIHLPEQHHHDNSHHQHQAEVHAHDLSNQLLNIIDVSYQESHANVIEIDSDCNSQKINKPKNPSAVIISSAPNPYLLVTPFLVSIKISVTSSKLDYLNYSTINPRAPPLTS